MIDKRDELTIQQKVDCATATVPAAITDPLLGTLIDGRYLLLSLLGEGGMGHVYRARQVHMDKLVAIKLIHEELAHIDDVARRFEREAISSSRLSNPHCIVVTDFGRTSNGTLYLAMELLEGIPLDKRIEEDVSLPPPLALHIAAQILMGLDHAHEQGVIHRDLKPENVYLTQVDDDPNFVKILDFGIAKLASGDDTGANLTKTGIVFGTPKYLSPEQALGDKIDHRSDLYAVGIIIFEMLAGEPPFMAENAMDTMSMHLTAPVPSLSQYGDFPRGLQTLVDRAMAKKKEDRFANAREFLDAVEQIDPEAAPPSVTVEVIRKTADHIGEITAHKIAGVPKKLMALLILVTVALAIVGLVYLLSGDNRPHVPIADAAGRVTDLGTKTDTVKALLTKAEQQLKSGNPGESVITVKEVLAMAPDLAPARLLLAHGEFITGGREAAMDNYDLALTADPSLATDIRLNQNLEEALKWQQARQKAANIMAVHGKSEGRDKLAELCNSALTELELRGVARSALAQGGHGEKIDWLTSLTADFLQQKKCKQRREIIEQMAELKDPRFLPLLMEYRPVSKKQGFKTVTTNTCIGTAVQAAIETLTAISNGEAVEKATDN